MFSCRKCKKETAVVVNQLFCLCESCHQEYLKVVFDWLSVKELFTSCPTCKSLSVNVHREAYYPETDEYIKIYVCNSCGVFFEVA